MQVGVSRNLGIPYLGVLLMRILLLRVLFFEGPLFPFGNPQVQAEDEEQVMKILG